jgi:hypothetical protein
MTTIIRRIRQIKRLLCLTLATAMVTGPSVSAMAQTNAAAMAVRQRVEGLSPEGPESPQPPGASAAVPGQVSPSSSGAGKIDTRYISPNAAAVIVIRPAQLLTAPIAQMLPVELVVAAVGFEPAEIEEIVAFVDPPTAGLSYGVTFKFKNPVRASSIPLERRGHVQLAELNGKKYLRSSNPILYSLYAPNNRTIVAAPDGTLQQLTTSAVQPKAGPMMDRIRDVPAGSDLYVNIDVASLRPLLPLMMGGVPANAQPAVKQQLEMVNLISAVELTLNISNPAPSSFVARCTDEAAAQKIEAIVQEAKQKASGGTQTEQPGVVSPASQAVARYRDRLLQLFPMQREGTNYTFFRVDGQNPSQQQFVSAVVVLSGALASMAPEIMAARNAALHAQGAPAIGGQPGPVGSPEAGQPQ